jgi:FkbM family methyltransferase
MLRPVTVQTPDGVRYYCRARKGDINVISDYYEGQQIKRYWKPKPGDVVIDCGSNVGKYALIAARRGARTFAVEPDRSCIPILRRNRKLNDVVDWLTIIHAAIGASVGERTFYLAKDGARSTTRWVYTYKPRTVTVSEITIDEIVSSYRLTRLDWLKLDVEASEYEAIEGAKKSLPLIRYVYLEVHYADLEKKINDVLLPAGFTVVEMARLDKNRAWLLYSRE